ncbi:MAG: putative heme transporter [Acidimicrobiaceae bacterium]|nr:putative heme transporter [Acidimicrobiaceae bacterium]
MLDPGIASVSPTVTGLSPDVANSKHRPWRTVLVGIVAVGGVAALGLVASSTLADPFAAFAHLDWPWLPLGLVAEAGSMAAFARSQRRLLKVGGTPVHLGSVMAVTYAGNAISVSLPLAGPEVSTAFTFRQFSRHGIDPAVAAWALAVSGIVSSFAFAVVLAGGAVTSGNTTAALFGLAGAVAWLLPSVWVLAALRYRSVRSFLNRLLARLIGISRRLGRRPGPGAEDSLEQFLDRVASLKLPTSQYAEVLALALWNWVADCLCLACAIRATGSNVPWQGLFLAYGAGMTAASIGLTPGGLGIVEAALSAALVVAGIRDDHALAAVLVYRLISFWLVMVAGWAVMAVLTRNTRITQVANQPAPRETTTHGRWPMSLRGRSSRP